MLKEGATNPNPFGGQDRAVMNPGSTLRPRLANPAGPTNPEVFCISAQASDGRQIALMANYWLHYVGGVPREDLSADYFGEFCRRVERELAATGDHPPVVALLANGPCGDVNSNDYSGRTPAVKRGPYEKIKIVAGDLASEVLRVRATLHHHDWVQLKAATEDLELANGSNGYLPTPAQHDLGGYETWLGTNRVERDASVKITASILSLLERVRRAEGPR